MQQVYLCCVASVLDRELRRIDNLSRPNHQFVPTARIGRGPFPRTYFLSQNVWITPFSHPTSRLNQDCAHALRQPHHRYTKDYLGHLQHLLVMIYPCCSLFDPFFFHLPTLSYWTNGLYDWDQEKSRIRGRSGMRERGERERGQMKERGEPSVVRELAAGLLTCVMIWKAWSCTFSSRAMR